MNRQIALSKGLNLINFDPEEIKLIVRDIDCDIFLIIKNGGKKRLMLDFYNTSSRVFLWNECEDEIVLEEDYSLFNNSNVVISFADMFANTLTRNVKAEAFEPDSHCKINCAILGRGKKIVKVDAVNTAEDSDMYMENSSVLLKDSFFQFDAAGIIKKGAKKSTNFQRNKSLTLQAPKKIKITPTLYIDENDIEAGHGCSIGDVDENVMYYLNSRGLSRDLAMSLIVDGFLKNISTNIEDSALRQEVEQKIERQVSKYVRHDS